MKKVLGVLAVLLIVTPTMAEPLVSIGDAQWDGDLMYFDLVMVDNQGMTDLIKTFGARAVLSGADAGRFVSQPGEVNGLTGAKMAIKVTPASYAWAGFFLSVMAEAPAPTEMAFGQSAYFAVEHVALNTIAPDTVLARFVFQLQDPPGPPVTEVNVHILSYSGVENAPVFTDSAAKLIEGATVNDGANIIPEPATMGLLGLGLLGLVLRRKK
ncbi:MAG: PEP-CTERM sorting domain-containing protein [Anaerolineaceae bacterium]|nr:PEP-CTERM sorting domain-containing protein [Anaerolineaceae bacterium]